MVSGYVVLDEPTLLARLRASGLLPRRTASGESVPPALPARTMRDRLLGLLDPALPAMSHIRLWLASAWASVVLGVSSSRASACRAFAGLSPALRLTRRRLRLLGAGCGAGFALPVLAWLVVPSVPQKGAQAATLAATTPPKPAVWIEMGRPITQFALEPPDLERAALRHAVLRNQYGGRSEQMVWHNGEGGRPLAAVILARTGRDEPLGQRSFFVDVARAAARQSLAVTRWSEPAAQVTKFGPVATADVQLGAGDAERACLAFQWKVERSGLDVTGWYCGPEGKPATRPALSCFIDRLDLVNAADDVGLRDAFVEAERRRSPACGARRTGGRKLSWLDPDASVPVLKSTADVR